MDDGLVAEDLGPNDLLLLSYDNKLYVMPAPDAEPVAIFDAQQVIEALGAAACNNQTKIATLKGIQGYTVQRFGGPERYRAAQAIKIAEEALELALRVLIRDTSLERATRSVQLRLQVMFDRLTNGEEVLLKLDDLGSDQLAGERADVLMALCCAAEVDGQDLMVDGVKRANRDVGRGMRWTLKL